ncbi:MAG: hypothetical protein OEQ18_09630 [Gammaproteobacteria bacterium]|nr:hypothetical protein [Gammaproteobacteria bacterium]
MTGAADAITVRRSRANVWLALVLGALALAFFVFTFFQDWS